MLDTMSEQSRTHSRSSHMEQRDLQAEVHERRDAAGVWGVEAVDNDDDGSVHVALFDGPDARERAIEYAHTKYASVKVA